MAGAGLRMNGVFACVCVPILAIAAGFVVAAGQGPLDRPTAGGGRYYIALARAIASGNGYTLEPSTRDPWPHPRHPSSLPLAPLARGNILLLPFFFAGIGLALQPSLCRHWKRMATLTIIFLTPATFWILRNYHVSGEFPVLSAVEGETFYGGNNAFVATDLTNWGYWTFPNNIPGETPKFELAKRMNEIELNRYYKQKGMEYIRENWFAYPRLILGKLIRGFVPVPFVPVKATYLAFLIRL